MRLQVSSLIRLAASSALATVVLLPACGGDGGPTGTSGTPTPAPTPAPTPTPTPTPTPAANANGFWLVESGSLSGYGIDVSQSGTQLDGRSVFPIRDVTGPLKGNVTAAGHVGWTTNYGNSATDSFDGDLSRSGNTIEGRLTFDIPSANFRGGANIVLTLQHR